MEVTLVKRSFLIGCIVFLLAIPVVAGETVEVLQPNTTAYSASEVATLTQAIQTLEGKLTNWGLGSRRYFASNEWQSRDFARYTAGTLAEMGYVTRLVSAAGWPDGVHTWVLVGIPLGGKTAWVPVEASPAAGHTQQTLGYVPKSTDSAGKIWFLGSYVAFTDVAELPPNQPPVAKLRAPTSVSLTRGGVRFLAIESYDPDGQIVLYQWDFGDGETWVSDAAVANHAFAATGTYTVSLTVIDSGGKRGTTTRALVVAHAEAREPTPSSSGGGCGCGK
jgi:hypothetical protein